MCLAYDTIAIPIVDNQNVRTAYFIMPGWVCSLRAIIHLELIKLASRFRLVGPRYEFVDIFIVVSVRVSKPLRPCYIKKTTHAFLSDFLST